MGKEPKKEKKNPLRKDLTHFSQKSCNTIDFNDIVNDIYSCLLLVYRNILTMYCMLFLNSLINTNIL